MEGVVWPCPLIPLRHRSLNWGGTESISLQVIDCSRACQWLTRETRAHVDHEGEGCPTQLPPLVNAVMPVLGN